MNNVAEKMTTVEKIEGGHAEMIAMNTESAVNNVAETMEGGQLSPLAPNPEGVPLATAPTVPTAATPLEAVANPPEEEKVTSSQLLMELTHELELFHDEGRRAFARINVGSHNETWDLGSNHFRYWLQHLFYQAYGKVIPSDALKQVVETLRGKAIFAGAQHQLHLRVAEHEGAFWYDLADAGWQAVRVTATGWEIVQSQPTLFRRFANTAPQVLPQAAGGNVKKFLDLVNVKSEHDKCLLLAFLVYCFIPGVPKPLVHPHGEKGAAKSTMCRLLKKTVDPGNLETMTLPTDKNEMVLKLAQNYMPLFDNVDTLSAWQSDMFCCASTGGGMTRRELFTNDNEIIYRFKRPVILNGINAVAQRSDLLDRTVLLELERIKDSSRKTEEQLWKEFEEVRASILGGVFDTLSKAMRIYPTVTLTSLPRMADFAKWGCAIAEALGYTQAFFLAAYAQNIGSANRAALDSHPLATTILQMMTTETIVEKTAGEMLVQLETVAERNQIRTNDKLFPKNAASLTRRLKEVKSNLQADGIQISVTRDARNNSVITITRVAEAQELDEIA